VLEESQFDTARALMAELDPRTGSAQRLLRGVEAIAPDGRPRAPGQVRASR